MPIGRPVLGVARFRPFGEQGVGFIEKQNPVVMFRVIEQAGQILFRLAHVLGNHLG